MLLRKWSPEKKWPVIVELPENGGYKDALGDECRGRPEDCLLGFKMSGGHNFLKSANQNEHDQQK